MKCADAKCTSHWGKDQAAELATLDFRHCDLPVVDFWPHADIAALLRKNITSDASCWIAVMTGGHTVRIVGFTWGMPLSRRWERLSHEARAALRDRYGEGVAHDPTFTYQLELGVLTSQRRQGLARRLTEARNQDFLAQGYTYGVLKVLECPNPSVTYSWYTRVGYEVIHRFSDGCVLLGRQLQPGLFLQRGQKQLGGQDV